MATWSGWQTDVLRGLGAPVTIATQAFLTGWQQYEQSNCSNNPLNTTQQEIGASVCNSAGVKSYPTPAVGTAATVTTLGNGYYDDIVAALRTGDPYTYHDPQAVAREITTWGTPNFASAYLVTAGSPAGAPPPTPSEPPPVGTPAGALSGWHQLTHALAKGLIGELHSSDHMVAAANRRLARAGRK